jgi:hypothetical protein
VVSKWYNYSAAYKAMQGLGKQRYSSFSLTDFCKGTVSGDFENYFFGFQNLISNFFIGFDA